MTKSLLVSIVLGLAAFVMPSPGNVTVAIYSSIQVETLPNRVTLESPYPIYPAVQQSYIKVYGPDKQEVSVGDPRYISPTSMSIAISRSNEYGTYSIYWRILDSDDLTLREGITTFAVTPASMWCDADTILLACLLLCLYVLFREVEVWRSHHYSVHLK